MTSDMTALLNADERTMLVGFLQWQRDAIARKCEGLGEELAHRATLPTSPLMSVAGLVSHLRWVEHSWFETIMLGEPDRGPWTDDDPDEEFKVDDVPLARLLEEYRRQAARSDEIVASLGLDARTVNERRAGGHPSVRWVLIHMIEETARHAGHIDVIREHLDGTTGI